ncbi:Microtubule-associated protein [Thalictrum thalictroides]|uniref:Microtubule-associated protein n=1 Tax=Thalictrum thalictroides TaxID=46969 RepID=A0A7J6UWM1_THATH|nr:Microtubule-associated protein [Thalictrum thalictroides]
MKINDEKKASMAAQFAAEATLRRFNVAKACQAGERKILDRELARAKVTANRVAVVVANEWKDANDKVMPVRQWLEDRRCIQGEMQQL